MGYGENWAGGRTYVDSRGRKRWIIRRRVSGILHTITLDVESESEALGELRLFERDTAGYRAAREQASLGGAVIMTLDDLKAFRSHLEGTGRSRLYIKGIVGPYLSAWLGKLARRDLRSLDAKTLKRLLAEWTTARKHRIIAFKSFCSWLVEQGRLDPTESPGRFLSVPAARRTHDRKGYTIQQVERLYSVLHTQTARDVLLVRAKTGMHWTEINRLSSGLGEIRVQRDCGLIAATITFKHKTGRPKTISVDLQTLAAILRMRQRGGAPTDNATSEVVALAVKRANARGDTVKEIHFGALRHSFATWLKERGELYHPTGRGLPVETVAEALGHTNTKTTALHYLSVGVPPMYRVAITLNHPEDPALLSAKQLAGLLLESGSSASSRPSSGSDGR